jgi:L-fucose mutarotase
MKFFPLDTFVELPVTLMGVVAGDNTKPTVWEDYRSIIKKYDQNFTEFAFIERFPFYERTKNAYAVVATSDQALYANIILKKGVIIPQ